MVSYSEAVKGRWLRLVNKYTEHRRAGGEGVVAGDVDISLYLYRCWV